MQQKPMQDHHQSSYLLADRTPSMPRRVAARCLLFLSLALLLSTAWGQGQFAAAPQTGQTELLVSNLGGDAALRFDPRTGQFVDIFASGNGLAQTAGLTFGPDGNLYLISVFTKKVVRFDGRTGAFKDVFVASGSGGLRGPFGLAFGPDNNLYITSLGTGNVLRFDGWTGAFLDVFIPRLRGGLKTPLGLAFGPDHNLYVSDAVHSLVLRYGGRSGRFLGVAAFGDKLEVPTFLTFRPSRNEHHTAEDEEPDNR